MNSPQTATTPGPAGAANEPDDASAGASRVRSLGAFRPGPHHLALVAVLALSAVLNVHRLAQNGYSNIFYSAGVKSMLRSLHNFFFVSFDPGGLVTIDKPPLALWVQAASAKVFGFTPLSLLLPEAIAGVLAVAFLYRLLTRRFGWQAGLAGALALAVFPSFVAVSRDNGVDSVLILLMVLACDAGVRAVETGRWRSLLWCGVLVGLAFNAKTLAAVLIVPGIVLAVVACGPGTIPRRVMQLLVAGLLMGVVAFSWIAVVELVPTSSRPYVGGSTNNSELGLTFGYNGFGRVGGEVGGPNQIPSGTGALVRAHPSPSAHPRPSHVAKPLHAPVVHPLSATLPDGRARNPIPFGGATGPFRLFGVGLGDQGAWIIPFSLFGLLGIAAVILLDGRTRVSSPPEIPRPPLRRDPRLGALIVIGSWFLLEAAVLSLSKGIVHPYYVSAIAPPAAGMAGAGAVAFVALAVRPRRDWRLLLAPCAIITTVAAQIVLLHRERYLEWFVPFLVVGAAVGICFLLTWRRSAPLAMGATVCLLLVAPTAYATTTWLAPVEGTFPAAGAKHAAGTGGVGVYGVSLRRDRALVSYVSTHRPGSRWAALTTASDTAAPMILLGLDAGSLAGFSGTDPALDGRGLARLVSRGQARYVALGGEFSTRGGNRATVAVVRACRELSPSVWEGAHVYTRSLVLFDCAGRERELAAE